MKSKMNAREVLSLAAVVPVMTVDDAAAAVDLARALVDGGLPVLEITLRSGAALDAIARIAAEVPDAVVGAGTVRNARMLDEVVDAGARFAISPGINAPFAAAAAACSVPVIPGIATPGELMLALEHGLDTLKLFPAETVGGVGMLKSLYGPFPDVRFCPTGGIDPVKAADYLALPNVLCVGGTWLAPKEMLAARDWAGVRRLAEQAAALRG